MGSRLREKESGRNGSNNLRCEVTLSLWDFPMVGTTSVECCVSHPLVKPIWQPKAGTPGGGCGSSA